MLKVYTTNMIVVMDFPSCRVYEYWLRTVRIFRKELFVSFYPLLRLALSLFCQLCPLVPSPLFIRGSDRFQTASNEAYNVVRQTGRTTEGDYEVPNPPSASSQPATTAPADTTAGDSLYECV